MMRRRRREDATQAGRNCPCAKRCLANDGLNSRSSCVSSAGFIVVQIDGVGTSNRSKAFHDVAWKNLGDAGFPDRILWHRAVAAKYPYYDITRVGIYGAHQGEQPSTCCTSPAPATDLAARTAIASAGTFSSIRCSAPSRPIETRLPSRARPMRVTRRVGSTASRLGRWSQALTHARREAPASSSSRQQSSTRDSRRVTR